MYSDPLDILNNIICYIMYFSVCHLCMQRRYGLLVTIAAEAALFVVHMLITNAVAYLSVLRMLCCPIIHTAVLCFLYREKWYRVLLITCLLILALWITELIGVATFYPPELVAGDLTYGTFMERVLIRIRALMILAFIDLILVLILRRHTLNLTRSQYCLIVGFPFSINVFTHFWLGAAMQNPDANLGYALFALTVCVVSFLLMFILAFRSSRQTLLEAENRLLSDQLELQVRHYEGLSSQYEGIRMMRHDIAKHMNAVLSLLEEGKNKEASDYFEEVRELAQDQGYGICEHPVADAFLHHFIETTESKGIRTSFTVSLPASIPVSPSDLICIFGNLLDNALEACTDTENPYIDLRCAFSRPYLLISMDNSTAIQDSGKGLRIPQLQRGLGTEILRQIAEKYNGKFSAVPLDGHFHSELTLLLKQDHMHS